MYPARCHPAQARNQVEASAARFPLPARKGFANTGPSSRAYMFILGWPLCSPSMPAASRAYRFPIWFHLQRQFDNQESVQLRWIALSTSEETANVSLKRNVRACVLRFDSWPSDDQAKLTVCRSNGGSLETSFSWLQVALLPSRLFQYRSLVRTQSGHCRIAGSRRGEYWRLRRFT